MENTDYCNHCHGDGGTKENPCDECAGTGRATGAYTKFQQPPKVNGWSVQHVIEFIAACIILVFSCIAYLGCKLFRKEV